MKFITVLKVKEIKNSPDKKMKKAITLPVGVLGTKSP